jgi:hypothetical protein
MAIKDIFVGDIGTHFQCNVKNLVNEDPGTPFDLSTVEEVVIVFMDPDGVEKEFDGVVVSDGTEETDAIVEYVTAEITDLHMDGSWEYYAWFSYPLGSRRTSSIRFSVYPGRQSELPSEEE